VHIRDFLDHLAALAERGRPRRRKPAAEAEAPQPSLPGGNGLEAPVYANPAPEPESEPAKQ
jgi:hypothetical protein